jgi:hypothetical protein
VQQIDTSSAPHEFAKFRRLRFGISPRRPHCGKIIYRFTETRNLTAIYKSVCVEPEISTEKGTIRCWVQRKWALGGGGVLTISVFTVQRAH